jgi:hypothetical protein
MRNLPGGWVLFRDWPRKTWDVGWIDSRRTRETSQVWQNSKGKSRKTRIFEGFWVLKLVRKTLEMG